MKNLKLKAIIFIFLLIAINELAIGSSNQNETIPADSIIQSISNIFRTAIEQNENKTELQLFLNEERGKLSEEPSPEEIAIFSLAINKRLKTDGKLIIAAKSLKQAAEYLEECKEYTEKDNNYLSIIYNQIGMIYNDLGDFNQTFDYYLAAFKKAEETNWDEGYGNFYNNVSLLYTEQGNLTKAEELLLKALEGALKNNWTKSIAIYYTNLASTNFTMGKVQGKRMKHNSICESFKKMAVNKSINTCIYCVLFILLSTNQIYNSK